MKFQSAKPLFSRAFMSLAGSCRSGKKLLRRWQTSCAFFSTDGASANSTSYDTICELASSNLRFGVGSTSEIGSDLSYSYCATRVVVFTDPNVRRLPCMDVVLESLDRHRITSVLVYDRVRVEPNDASFLDAIGFLKSTEYDAVVALGGGSVMDTAKAANLYACHDSADLYDFVNAPVGRGLPVPARNRRGETLKPLIAIPTTAGTGSETTGVAIFDDSGTRSKTGIASHRIRPSLAIVDPANALTMPRKVATYSGLDVLCHAIESYTALPYTKRVRPSSPQMRPAYQGSNPIADVWSLFALRTCAQHLVDAAMASTEDSEDERRLESRSQMLLAASAAAMGFGNAGVHLCHGMSYPISSQVKVYQGYDHLDLAIDHHPLVPHGLSVIVSAPAVFRFTAGADPDRHAMCARILSEARVQRNHGQWDDSPRRSYRDDAGAWLAYEIRMICCELDVKLGLRPLGYTEEDIPALVQGTLPQHRVTKISPRQPIGENELDYLFRQALDEE